MRRRYLYDQFSSQTGAQAWSSGGCRRSALIFWVFCNLHSCSIRATAFRRVHQLTARKKAVLQHFCDISALPATIYNPYEDHTAIRKQNGCFYIYDVSWVLQSSTTCVINNRYPSNQLHYVRRASNCWRCRVDFSIHLVLNIIVDSLDTALHALEIWKLRLCRPCRKVSLIDQSGLQSCYSTDSQYFSV